MASVRFGGGVSEIRGSIAGNTFSRSRSGAIIRNRITPVNPNTQAQADFRTAFSIIAARFAELDGDARQSWDEFGALLTFVKNRLGESYTPSGRQAFQMCNMNLLLSTTTVSSVGGLPTYDMNPENVIDTPDFADTAKPQPPQFDTGIDEFNIALTAGAVTGFGSAENMLAPQGLSPNALARLMAETTPILRPSIRNVKNLYKSLGSIPFLADGVVNLLTRQNIVHSQTGLVAGMKTGIRLWTMNKSGLCSDKVEITAVTI